MRGWRGLDSGMIDKWPCVWDDHLELNDSEPPMLLPEELLHLIILASIDKPFSSSFPAAFERPSAELLGLSTVSRQLRRISLPFLVAFVHLKRLEHLEKLLQRCLVNPLLPKLIKYVIFLLPYLGHYWPKSQWSAHQRQVVRVAPGWTRKEVTESKYWRTLNNRTRVSQGQ